jgi:hypothetical protein
MVARATEVTARPGAECFDRPLPRKPDISFAVIHKGAERLPDRLQIDLDMHPPHVR